jgi:hypothetical protein
VSEN